MEIKKTFDCCDPWFTHIKEKRKIVEGRLYSNKYSDLEVNDVIKLIKPKTNTSDSENEFILLRIIKLVRYSTFEEMINKETIEKILPDNSVKTIEDGVNVYRQFYSKSLENKYGVLAIHIEIV